MAAMQERSFTRENRNEVFSFFQSAAGTSITLNAARTRSVNDAATLVQITNQFKTFDPVSRLDPQPVVGGGYPVREIACLLFFILTTDGANEQVLDAKRENHFFGSAVSRRRDRRNRRFTGTGIHKRSVQNLNVRHGRALQKACK
jgi:hypothetical protein